MKEFVIDASVALGWLIDDLPSTYSDRVRELMIEGVKPAVPAHRRLEVANALLTASRRKLLQRDITSVISDIAALVSFIEVDGVQDEIGGLVRTGLRHKLTSYDAAYITLAVRRDLPLAS